jgi:hypothetical protein
MKKADDDRHDSLMARLDGGEVLTPQDMWWLDMYHAANSPCTIRGCAMLTMWRLLARNLCTAKQELENKIEEMKPKLRTEYQDTTRVPHDEHN